MPRATVLFTWIALAGCRSTPPAYQCDAGSCRGATSTFRADARPPNLLDVLVVVDPQVIATDPQRVKAGLASFPLELRKFPGTIDVQTAVVSSALDPAGEPVNLLSGACAPYGPPYIKDAPFTCGSSPNYDGTAGEALACLGPAPDGPSQPLEVVRRVIGADPSHPPMVFRGFVRERAVLMVVIISARDDASTGAPGDPAGLRAYWDGLVTSPDRPSPKRMAISLVVPFTPLVDGGVRPACAAAGAGVGSPPRLSALALADNGSAIVELCSDDWTPVFQPLSFGPGRLVMCLQGGVVDRDPATAGLQPDCIGHLTDPAGQPLADLPVCGAGPKPCLNYRQDIACDGSEVELSIDYDCLRPRGTLIELVCAANP